MCSSDLLTLNPNSTGSFAGAISGTGGSLVKSGAATYTLSGVSTYTGDTTINAGTLKAGVSSTGTVTNGAFGTGTITVASGATLDLNGFSVANTLNITGTGDSTNGALYNSSSTAGSATGAMTLAGASTIKTIGAMTLGAIDGAYALTANTTSTGTITFGGAVGGTNNLASLTTGASAGSAAVVISGGAITTTGDLNIGNAITLGASTTLTSGNTLTLGAALTGGGYSLTVTNNAIINAALSGLSSLSIGGTTTLGGNITTTGAQTYAGAVTLASADRTLTSSSNGAISLGATNGAYGLTISNGSGSITLAAIGASTSMLAWSVGWMPSTVRPSMSVTSTLVMSRMAWLVARSRPSSAWGWSGGCADGEGPRVHPGRAGRAARRGSRRRRRSSGRWAAFHSSRSRAGGSSIGSSDSLNVPQ